MKTKRLIILGASGNANDLLDIVEAINAGVPTWEIAGFLDDRNEKGGRFLGYRILGTLAAAPQFDEHFFVNCIGSDQSFHARPRIISRIDLPDERFATLVHPASSVSARARIAAGSYVSYGSSIGGNVTIGRHVSIAPGVIVGHDTMIDDFATLAPGAVVSGRAHVGRAAYLGARCVIRQKLCVGEESVVGMGAVVTRDTEARSIVAGVPARPLDISTAAADRRQQI